MSNLRIETVAVSLLKPDPDNARAHNEANLSAIAGSLEKFGQRKPIVIAGDNIVVAGNGTLEAAKTLGWTEIEVARVPNEWSWEQVRAYALADNRTAEMAEWNPQILAAQLLELDAVGWDVSEFGFESLEPPTDEPTGEGGLGNPIVSFNIVFDNEDQQSRFYQFTKYLKQAHGNKDTLAGRLDEHISQTLIEG